MNEQPNPQTWQHVARVCRRTERAARIKYASRAAVYLVSLGDPCALAFALAAFRRAGGPNPLLYRAVTAALGCDPPRLYRALPVEVLVDVLGALWPLPAEEGARLAHAARELHSTGEAPILVMAYGLATVTTLAALDAKGVTDDVDGWALPAIGGTQPAIGDA